MGSLVSFIVASFSLFSLSFKYNIALSLIVGTNPIGEGGKVGWHANLIINRWYCLYIPKLEIPYLAQILTFFCRKKATICGKKNLVEKLMITFLHYYYRRTSMNKSKSKYILFLKTLIRWYAPAVARSLADLVKYIM